MQAPQSFEPELFPQSLHYKSHGKGRRPRPPTCIVALQSSFRKTPGIRRALVRPIVGNESRRSEFSLREPFAGTDGSSIRNFLLAADPPERAGPAPLSH